MFTSREGNRRLFLCLYQIGCKFFICDFHHEQTWDRRLRKINNGCSENCSKLSTLLRSISLADTLYNCEKAINSLKKSTYWLENSNLRDCISKYWLNIKMLFLLFLMEKIFSWKSFHVFACL